MRNKILTVSEENYSELISILCERDRDLRRVVETLGVPPIWIRPTGFPTLVHIILEQQVSLASARATYKKIKLTLGENFSPESYLKLSDAELKNLGLSRQKTAYTRNLAEAVVAGDLNLDSLESLSDEEATNELIRLKGIGRWTADVYLLMCLRRADAFPVGDLGLIIGTQKLKKLELKPIAAELEQIGVHWQPYRAVATRIVWHFYLNR